MQEGQKKQEALFREGTRKLRREAVPTIESDANPEGFFP